MWLDSVRHCASLVHPESAEQKVRAGDSKFQTSHVLKISLQVELDQL